VVALILGMSGEARAVSRDFEALAKSAQTARESGRLEEAEGLYREALAKQPEWVDRHRALGTLLYERKRYAEARDHFDLVAQARPGEGMPLAYRGLCEYHSGLLEAARASLEVARARGLTDRKLLLVATLHLAILRTRFSHFEGAYALLEQYANGGVDHPALTLAFGLSLLRIPLLPDEVAQAQRELILMAGRAGFHMAQGSSGARRAFEELVSRYPTTPNVHYAYGTYLLKVDRDAARIEFRRELRLSPTHREAKLQIAFEEVRRGNAQEGERLAREVVAQVPDFFAAHLALGRALLELDRVGEAISALERAVTLAPDSPQSHFSLSLAYRRAGRPEDATRERTEFVRLDQLSRDRDVVQVPD
jgi:tetratricopeptide (TPR) repeat protein